MSDANVNDTPHLAIGRFDPPWIEAEDHYFVDGVEVTLDEFRAAAAAALEARP